MRLVSLILLKSLKYFLIIVTFDAILGFGLYLYTGFDIAAGVLSDILILEVAFLFILSGLLDFSQAQTTVSFRRLLGDPDSEYSADKHREAQVRGAMLVLTGVWVILLAVALSLLLLSP
jgi:hypothetical protein